MSDTLAKSASELLALEMIAQERAFSESEEVQWLNLVTDLFGRQPKGPHERRSFRIPTSIDGKISISGELWDCTIAEISQLNITIASPILTNVSEGFQFRLQNLVVQDKEVELSLSCEIVRARKPGELHSSSYGASINMQGTPNGGDLFFTKVYYPAYLYFLNQLSLGKAVLIRSP